MRKLSFLTALAAVVLAVTTTASAANISGEYIEARTCDVYTGPCFANAEMDLCGKEALMAWKVDEGSWNDVDVTGMGVALIVNAEGTLGDDGVFGMSAGKVDSVILVDERATRKQHDALVNFVRSTAKGLTENVVAVRKAPVELKNDHLSGRGTFTAGDVAQIQTRGLRNDDCVCTNEIVYYQPLNDVDNFSPVYSQTLSYQGSDLNNKWTNHSMRSGFLATFRY